MKHQVLGTLVGNTGDASKLLMVMTSSFAGRRGEFVRISHQERDGDQPTDVLGRIVSINRVNALYDSGMGSGVNELELMPGARVTGESIVGRIELIGFNDPETGHIRIPRRPLDPGAKVQTVDYHFLSAFYEFDEQTGLHIGNLVGYDRGENIVPVFLDVNRLVTEHLAVLAMTGAGKSYAVGRIIERLVAINNGTVIVFDPHGEYGRALAGGKLRFSEHASDLDDPRDKRSIPIIQETLQRLTDAGAGAAVYSPQIQSFRHKYAGKNRELALQFDHFEMDDISQILPGLTEPQQRVLDVAIRYWRTVDSVEPRDINRLRHFLGDGLDVLRQWDELSQAEAAALNGRSAAVASMKLSRVLSEAQAFYSAALSEPTNIYDMTGRPTDKKGKLVVIDLQGLSDTAKQVITALISSELLHAASSKSDPIRPCMVIYEEGHNFAPSGQGAVSHRIIRKIAGEGRKFGVGFAIVSQRPSKLDPDVTSQCNTIIVMRLKNPDDQRFIAKTSDMVSQSDLDELPSLSTGEALIFGRSITAPLLVKVGTKALIHGGESPDVLGVWGRWHMAHYIVERIRDEVRTLALARQHLSLWTERGLPDYSCSLHSAGTTYWNTLGAMLDFDAIVEMPAPQIGPFAFAGDDVRSDSLWFDRSGHHPIVVVEFERYTRQTDQLKLSGKVDNLLLAYHRWDQQPQVLVLSYWTKGLAALPNHEVLRQRVSQGFTTSAQERVDGARGCELLFFQTVLSESEFGRWRLSEIRERGQI